MSKIKIKIWLSVNANNFRVLKKFLSSIYNTQVWIQKRERAKAVMILKIKNSQTSNNFI